MEWTPVLVSALIAAVVALLTALIPPLFRKRVDDTEIMARLQQIANEAVKDKAEMQKKIDRLENKLNDRTKPNYLDVIVEQQPLSVTAKASYAREALDTGK